MIEVHPKRSAIEVELVVGVKLDTIAERYGVSKFSACRYRQTMRRRRKADFAAIRRSCRAAGITSETFGASQ